MSDLEQDVRTGAAKQRPSFEWIGWIKTVSIALTVVLLLHAFVFHLSKVEGHSMEPTLHDRDWLFVNKLVYLLRNPKLDEVVILRDPTDDPDKRLLVKRVVGVPGDKIEIRQKVLFRNGVQVEEPYVDTAIEDFDYGPYTVPEGFYFVMGDNRHSRASRDSRSFGPVERERINGRADWIVWPMKEMNGL
ncbi:signal peptidase I [Paenibacillus curdlanolyticus YK9]|uniref:Signal peptidase I n=1 Tax=Paenibacillus curdlanolyticus YK9 TaxID=717606 RepID=E0IB05_9BACL|nr:signal peptidase I [Paenibacillus curdlanolyticus]EFM10296.1 signal peptidase I [Paenibacillus curdlanolyticus YK9]